MLVLIIHCCIQSKNYLLTWVMITFIVDYGLIIIFLSFCRSEISWVVLTGDCHLDVRRAGIQDGLVGSLVSGFSGGLSPLLHGLLRRAPWMSLWYGDGFFSPEQMIQERARCKPRCLLWYSFEGHTMPFLQYAIYCWCSSALFSVGGSCTKAECQEATATLYLLLFNKYFFKFYFNKII